MPVELLQNMKIKDHPGNMKNGKRNRKARTGQIMAEGWPPTTALIREIAKEFDCSYMLASHVLLIKSMMASFQMAVNADTVTCAHLIVVMLS